MTTEEFRRMMALLRTTWSAPPTMPDGSEAAYRLLVGPLDVQVVMAGLGRCAEREPKWRPSPAELRAACTHVAGDRVSFVGWEEAWPLIEQAVRRLKGGTSDPDFPERHQAAIDWLRTQDEAVAAWAARRGLRGPGSLGAEPVHDPEFGGAVRQRLKLDHQDVVGLAQERLALGSSAFVEREFLVRGGTTAGGIRELVDRLRPDAPKQLPEAA